MRAPLKIILLCMAGAVLYGILHDMITVHVCPEYFTVFHPQVLSTDNLWPLAVYWGVAASWMVGLLCGLFVALASSVGSPPYLGWMDLVRPLAVVLTTTGFLAAALGRLAFVNPMGFVNPLVDMVVPVADLGPKWQHDRGFMADYIAHNVSYDASAALALVLCAWILYKRHKMSKPAA